MIFPEGQEDPGDARGQEGHDTMTTAEETRATGGPRRWSKPVPVPDELSIPYWEGARRNQLVVQRCASCGTHIHPPRVACRVCQGIELVPTAVAPHGTVYSFTVTYVPFVPGFEDDVPYALVLVDLDVEPGTRLATILRDCPLEDIAVGMPVKIIFIEVTDGLTLPYAVRDARAALSMAEPRFQGR